MDAAHPTRCADDFRDRAGGRPARQRPTAPISIGGFFYRAMGEVEGRMEMGEGAGTPPGSGKLLALVDALGPNVTVVQSNAIRWKTASDGMIFTQTVENNRICAVGARDRRTHCAD